ncbi:MAG TPA: hypothetical protein VMA72_12450, partial [Streptosporangiaceae bacterium]|nr:hypothetical protein [Streptosporangiaceae bacterium]
HSAGLACARKSRPAVTNASACTGSVTSTSSEPLLAPVPARTLPSDPAPPRPPASTDAATSDALPSEAVLTEAVLTEAVRSLPRLGGQVLPDAVPETLADPLRAAASAVDVLAPLLLSLAPPGELAGHSAVGVLASGNGANAPADNPEEADTLPARALRPRRREPASDDVDADPQEAELPASLGASAPGEASRGTPGMSQPGSVMARLPPLSAEEFQLVFLA